MSGKMALSGGLFPARAAKVRFPAGRVYDKQLQMNEPLYANVGRLMLDLLCGERECTKALPRSLLEGTVPELFCEGE